VTFLRVTRDQRGYETTFLLHTPRPGDRPRVLYWYRTAPSVRVGRRPLDEDAIRALEEQHPDIEFDWPHLLEEAESIPPEVERRPERPRRKPQRPREPEPPVEPPAATAPVAPPETLAPAEEPVETAPRVAPRVAPARWRNALLDQLVGREIATRLRARYEEIATRVNELPEGDARASLAARADALDPDRWSSAEAILDGIRHADEWFDHLKRDLPPEAE
jgi:hypothetical protein